MSIKVVYFASLKELLGHSETLLPTPTSTVSVIDIWQQANPDLTIPSNTLAAVNMEYVSLEHPVIDNDEVAFFPPVTGG